MDQETGYAYYGARYYDSQISQWLSVDRLADKYPHSSPYVFSGNNPVRYIDPNGDSLNIAGLLWFDKTWGTNIIGALIKELEAETGLGLIITKVNRNQVYLDYLRDENGDAILQEGGSSLARGDLLSIIKSEKRVYVLGTMKETTRTAGMQQDNAQIKLNPNQINGFVRGTRGVDKRTMGFGMVFLHEVRHWLTGLKDDKEFPGTGPIVDHMNSIRGQLGPEWGERSSYAPKALPSNGRSYIPFGSAARIILRNGVYPFTHVEP
ncbi:RHS repeat-associated core domain-containing protein [Phaeocystidibacter marisrubri]|uniref:RHS repeat-associated core domain-containing protein n=1 Tax=Phaeocystidibacter marisrubri TaxID=1577780 RepID=UPI0019BB0AB9|nr:RHS repeat-associated core domain-containing protein [Phaeocystidibacter marisrubri]GGH69916.1 hypothetical protein GCM10011318_11430 [Phaeocystidibacter marisrubri]